MLFLNDKYIQEICNKRVKHIKENSISINDYIVVCKYLTGAWWFDLQNGIIYSTQTKKKLESFKCKNGYLAVKSHFEGRESKIYIHRAIALIANGVYSLPNINYDVDHINGIRDDNRIANLRIIPSSKNRSTGVNRIELSDDVIKSVVELYKQGVKNRDISKICGVSERTVTNLARRHGLYKERLHRPGPKYNVVFKKEESEENSESKNREVKGDN